MKSKIFISMLILVGILFCLTSCQDINNSTSATVTFNLDLSKIIKTSRNETSQNTEYILKLFAYNAFSYRDGSEIENLPLITKTENKVGSSGIIKVTMNIEIGLNVIFVGKLYEVGGETPIYSGNTSVVKIKATDNNFNLFLAKDKNDLEVSYRVEHYQQNVEDDNYTIIKDDTEIKIGKAGEETEAIAKSYDGFSVEPFEQKTISADGNTIIEIYYTRNIYTVTFICEDISYLQQQTVKHGGTVSITEPTKDGFVLVGWYTSNDDGETLIDEFDLTTSITSDITLYAKFVKGYTASRAVELIASLTTEGPYDIIVAGKITSDDISNIKTALKENTVAKINLDLSGTTGLTSIGDSAFSFCEGLTSIVIPSSVTSIGRGTFIYCSSLTSIEIPDSVTSIGDSAFIYCSSLTSIEIPDSVTSIGVKAFQSSGLTTVEIPEGVKSIGDSAFYYCSSLESITIPEGVKSIGDSAFYYCSSLTSIEIPGSVTSIGEYAFSSCSSLTSIEIQEGVKSIGDHAFEYCSGLTSIEIQEGVKSIGNYAFYCCSSLTSIEIPGSVTSIGKYAFYSCGSLTSIEIPVSVTSIGESAFSGLFGLTSITIPYGVTSIGDSAFAYCSGLTTIEIPESVKSIGDDAFYYCSSLESITIPASVTSIGKYAFSGCSNLTTVNYAGTQEEWESIEGYGSWALPSGATINYKYTD